jgi:hypothetical protein
MLLISCIGLPVATSFVTFSALRNLFHARFLRPEVGLASTPERHAGEFATVSEAVISFFHLQLFKNLEVKEFFPSLFSLPAIGPIKYASRRLFPQYLVSYTFLSSPHPNHSAPTHAMPKLSQ